MSASTGDERLNYFEFFSSLYYLNVLSWISNANCCCLITLTGPSQGKKDRQTQETEGTKYISASSTRWCVCSVGWLSGTHPEPRRCPPCRWPAWTASASSSHSAGTGPDHDIIKHDVKQDQLTRKWVHTHTRTHTFKRLGSLAAFPLALELKQKLNIAIKNC